jgi:hypothetical protein
MSKFDILKNKTIEDIHYNEDEGALYIEFEDGLRLIVAANDLLELVFQLEK